MTGYPVMLVLIDAHCLFAGLIRKILKVACFLSAKLVIVLWENGPLWSLFFFTQSANCQPVVG